MQKQTENKSLKKELEQLLRAAKTSIALFDMCYETLWRLYPDELFTISEESHDMLLGLLLDHFEEISKA